MERRVTETEGIKIEQEINGVSILMPCLNEENSVGICVKKALCFLEENQICGEVIVADNGSSDHSADIAEQMGARVIAVPERGYGAALRAGIAAAKYAYVIFADSDDSYNFLEIRPFYDCLKEGTDMVIGNRFMGGIEPGAMPVLHRYFGNPFLSGLGKRLYRVEVSDFHCGLRGARKDVLLSLDLCTTQMEFASEMIVKGALAGIKMKEIPCKLYCDKRGRKSHLRSFRDGIRHFLFLLRPAWFKN